MPSHCQGADGAAVRNDDTVSASSSGAHPLGGTLEFGAIATLRKRFGKATACLKQRPWAMHVHAGLCLHQCASQAMHLLLLESC